MTAPFTHGYPDWGRYSAQAARIYIDTTFSNIAVTPSVSTLLSTFSGDVPRVSPFVRAVTGNFDVFVQFHSDNPSAGGVVLHQMAFVLHAGQTWAHSIAVSAPWLVILARSNVATNEVALRVTESTQHGLTQFGAGGNDNIVISTVDSVPALATVTYDADQVWPGLAHWSFTVDPHVDVDLRLSVLSLAGGISGTVLRVTNPCEQSVWGLACLPAAPVQLRLINNSDLITTFTGAIAGQLAAPGI